MTNDMTVSNTTAIADRCYQEIDLTKEKKEVSVLIVDDEDYARRGLLRLFKIIQSEWIFHIVQASSGSKAVEILDRRRIDCILLDFQMPGGSGLEWTPKMLEKQSNAAIIMVTRCGDERVAVTAMKNGVVDYLVKGTITPWALKRTIVNAVERVQMRDAIQKQRKELLDAERHRVMIESLGAACHHLAQPVTTITLHLALMREKAQDPDVRTMIDECIETVDACRAIFQRFREVSEYRTVPYLLMKGTESASPDTRILEI